MKRVNNKDVEVSIDYYSNSYRVTGFVDGKKTTIKDSISGYDYAMRYIKNYSFRVLKARRENLFDFIYDYADSHPDCTDYSIHFINTENGGGLGFVCKAQLDGIIQQQIDKVTKSQTSQIILNVYDELER